MKTAAALLGLGLLMSALAGPPSATAAPRVAPVPPVVIAVIESGGMNVLHEDFGYGPGPKTGLPPNIPPRKMVGLPTGGSFRARLEKARSGALGRLKPGRLYGIKGTRIAGIYISPETHGRRDIFDRREHATGTTSAAIGLTHGTNPAALLVFVPAADPSSWEWLARQRWIDIVSTSYTGVGFSSDDPVASTCEPARSIRTITDRGGLVFSAAGNFEQAGLVLAPSGVPESYQVGGVDDDGRTYTPSGDPDDLSLTPTRPYETGDRFLFPAAGASSLRGSMPFGGTSGATPSTAGRAAQLIQAARAILGSSFTGTRNGALAIARAGMALPSAGPLEDGRLTSDELIDILHRSATPAEPPSPGRYLIEGYGALNEESVELGKRVLEGTAPLPGRPDEDAMNAKIESARAAVFSQTRCS